MSDATSPNQILIGNEISNSSFPYSFVNYTINGTGHFIYGNNNKGTISPSGTANIPDTSFAFASIPDFVSNEMWMQIGSGIPLGTANIPAAYRYTMNNYFANACGNTDSGEIEYLKPNLQIFPNPTSGILEINCDFNLNDYYQILDYQGRVFFFFIDEYNKNDHRFKFIRPWILLFDF